MDTPDIIAVSSTLIFFLVVIAIISWHFITLRRQVKRLREADEEWERTIQEREERYQRRRQEILRREQEVQEAERRNLKEQADKPHNFDPDTEVKFYANEEDLPPRPPSF